MKQVLVDRHNRPDDLVASGAVVEMRFRPGLKSLSLRAGKLLHLCVKAAGANLTEPVKHKIALKTVRDIANVTNADIREFALELVTTAIEIHILNPKERWLIGGIFSDTTIETGDGDLIFAFSETMQKLFKIDDRWAILSKTLLLSFESKYALRLFEIISLRRNMVCKYEDFALDDLRSRLGVEQKKLKLFADFRIRALDPAIEELNRLTDMKVGYELLKARRAVSGIRLHWSTDAPEETAKIPSSAEQAIPAAKPSKAVFPSKGGIFYVEPWVTIARANAPGYDVDIVAAAFRDFCIKRQIPLTMKGIEETFIGFCTSFVESRRNFLL